MRTWKRWFLGCTAAAAALFFVNPLQAFAVEPESEVNTEAAGETSDIYQLIVGDKILVSEYKVTGENYEGVQFDAETNTLTLNNANIISDAEWQQENWGGKFAPITVNAYQKEASLTVKLNGSNTAAYKTVYDSDQYGVGRMLEFHALKSVTFEGNGSLDISMAGDVDDGICLDADAGFCDDQMGEYRQPTDFIMKGCTISIDAKENTAPLGAMGIRASGDVSLLEQSTFSLNAEGSSTAFTGIASDINEGSKITMNVTIDDSQLRMIGPTGGEYSTVGISQNDGGIITMRNADVQMDLKDATGGRLFDCSTRGTEGKLILENSRLEGTEKRHGLTTGLSAVEVRENHQYYGWNSGEEQKEISKEELFVPVTSSGKADIKMGYTSYLVVPDPSGGEVLKGDVNGDGEVNIFDVGKLKNYIAGNEELSDEAIKAGDMDENGEINIFDIGKIKSEIVS